MTTFVLGWIIIAGITALVSYYSPTKWWMPLMSLVIGTIYTGLFILGGHDD